MLLGRGKERTAGHPTRWMMSGAVGAACVVHALIRCVLTIVVTVLRGTARAAPREQRG